jgi:hypothetical protein
LVGARAFIFYVYSFWQDLSLETFGGALFDSLLVYYVTFVKDDHYKWRNKNMAHERDQLNEVKPDTVMVYFTLSASAFSLTG